MFPRLYCLFYGHDLNEKKTLSYYLFEDEDSLYRIDNWCNRCKRYVKVS